MAGRRANGEGSVHRDRTSGRWVGQLIVEGRRRKVRARTRAEVVAKLDRLKLDAATGSVIDGRATVGVLLDLWRDRTIPNRQLSSSSIENYEWAYRVLRGEFGAVRLRSLDVDRVEQGLDRIARVRVRHQDRNPLSSRTLKLMRSSLRQALDLGVRRKLIPFNPASFAELTPGAAKTQHREALTVEQAHILWDALACERLGNLYRLMLTTGLRPGEALGLCWDAVELESRLLHVRRAVRRERGHPVLVADVKNSSSWRTIELPASAASVLRDQRRIVAQLRLGAAVWATVDADLVFPTARGTLWDPANARDELTRVCARAGLRRVRPHELRHSAASILNDQGVPLELIADLLGHRDITMLARTYRHRLRPSARAAVAVMDNLFETAT